MKFKLICDFCKRDLNEIYQDNMSHVNHLVICYDCYNKPSGMPPYSQHDYDDAKSYDLDLDEWNDYERYYRLGEYETYD